MNDLQKGRWSGQAALDELPVTGAYIVALPMKIKDDSGGPLRIVACVADKP